MKSHFTIIVIILLLSVPLTMKAEECIFTTSDGVELYVNIEGEGVPCLYIHGGPGSGAFWLNHFSGDILENKFKMIYLDQRGVSRSTSPIDGNFSLARMIEDFKEVRKALGIEKWMTMGHSFGGVLQTAYAHKYPEHHLGMLMVNCTLDLNSSIKSIIAFGKDELQIQDSAFKKYKDATIVEKAQDLIGKMIKKDVFWKVHYSRKENYYEMDSIMNSIENWNYDFSREALQIKDYFKNFRPLSKTIKVPVLFFYGKQDNAIGRKHFKGASFPNMLLWGAACKHVPFMECENVLEAAIEAYLVKFQPELKEYSN